MNELKNGVTAAQYVHVGSRLDLFTQDEYRPEEQEIEYKVKKGSIVVIIAGIFFFLRAKAQNVDTANGNDGTDLQKELKHKVQKSLADITEKNPPIPPPKKNNTGREGTVQGAGRL